MQTRLDPLTLMERSMRKTLIFVATLLKGISLTLPLPSVASTLDSEDQPAHAVVVHPHHDVLPLIISRLPEQEFFKAALVCKEWHQAQEFLLPQMLQKEARFILHHPMKGAYGDFLLSTVIGRYTQRLYDREGFTFVPFKQAVLPTGNTCLTDADITDYLPSLYSYVFHESKATLSAQDLLCLEAVLPWSRMAFNSTNETAKQNALLFLQSVCPNPQLVRFSPRLKEELFNPAPHTFVMTLGEFEQHKNFVSNVINTHKEHRLYLVCEESPYITEGVFTFPETPLLPRCHLFLSDPKGTVNSLDKSFLSCANLLSLEFLHFPALTQTGENCFRALTANALRLTFPMLSDTAYGFGYHLKTDVLTLDLSSLKKIDNMFLAHTQARVLTLHLPALTHIGLSFCTMAASLTTVRFKDMGSIMSVKDNFMAPCPNLNAVTKEKRRRFLEYVQETLSKTPAA